MLLIETLLVLVSLLVALVHPSLGARWFEKVERGLFELSRLRTLSVITVGIVALLLRAALLPIEPVPHPTIHDEFSYLLMSDTFAHGRLANPTHPMWEHFDAPYVNQHPTYVSKYFPGQGAVLAIGQVVFSHPFWGVWLSAGVMCAALCWMLQGWFAPFWALLGASLAVIRLGTFSYWVDSYFGGTLPAIGGALVLGALPRLRRSQRISDSLLMGLGFVILASTRPLEGMIFSLPIVAALLYWLWKSDRRRWLRALAPGALVLAAGFAFLLFYFWRTTGSPFQTPYQVNLQTQDPMPLFPWQPVRSFTQHSDMRALLFGSEMDQYNLTRKHFLISSIARVIQFSLFFLGPVLTVPFLMQAAGTQRRPNSSYPNIRLPAIVFWVSAFGLLLPNYYGPTYAAALTGVIYAMILAGMIRLRHWQWHGKNSGLAAIRALPVICVLLVLVRAAAPMPGISVPEMVPLTWCSPPFFPELDRTRVEAILKSNSGSHLALVRYERGRVHPVDWVQNLADIDHQRIVWANDLGPEKNQEIVEYFKGRKVWLVEPDVTPPRMTPYRPETSAATK